MKQSMEEKNTLL